MKKLFKLVANIIFVIVIVILLGYFSLRHVGKMEIYEVETGSMEQGIHVGDYVLILEQDLYSVGDIVTYKKDEYYVTHRIVKKVVGDKVITKGDANNTPDEEISVSSIEGKVILSGGLLNIVIDYKYIIVCFFLGVYLLSCYIGKDDDKVDIKENEFTRIRLKRRIRPEYRKKM